MYYLDSKVEQVKKAKITLIKKINNKYDYNLTRAFYLAYPGKWAIVG